MSKEYNSLSESELKEELLSLRKEQFNLRMQRAAGQVGRPHLFKNVRRNIARVKTYMTQLSKVESK